jgi:hypothetical protein
MEDADPGPTPRHGLTGGVSCFAVARLERPVRALPSRATIPPKMNDTSCRRVYPPRSPPGILRQRTR